MRRYEFTVTAADDERAFLQISAFVEALNPAGDTWSYSYRATPLVVDLSSSAPSMWNYDVEVELT